MTKIQNNKPEFSDLVLVVWILFAFLVLGIYDFSTKFQGRAIYL
jgi:hypothetical protein